MSIHANADSGPIQSAIACDSSRIQPLDGFFSLSCSRFRTESKPGKVVDSFWATRQR